MVQRYQHRRSCYAPPLPSVSPYTLTNSISPPLPLPSHPPLSLSSTPSLQLPLIHRSLHHPLSPFIFYPSFNISNFPTLSPPRPLYPTAVDIAASLEDGPGSHTVLPASPSQVHGQGDPPQSSASQVLFGSDLSQLDKDLIFDGLKKLYKKKVRIGSSFQCSFLYSCLGGSGTDGVAFEWSRRELNTISTDVML